MVLMAAIYDDDDILPKPEERKYMFVNSSTDKCPDI